MGYDVSCRVPGANEHPDGNMLMGSLFGTLSGHTYLTVLCDSREGASLLQYGVGTTLVDDLWQTSS
jgi:hypothetical protein